MMIISRKTVSSEFTIWILVLSGSYSAKERQRYGLATFCGKNLWRDVRWDRFPGLYCHLFRIGNYAGRIDWPVVGLSCFRNRNSSRNICGLPILAGRAAIDIALNQLLYKLISVH